MLLLKLIQLQIRWKLCTNRHKHAMSILYVPCAQHHLIHYKSYLQGKKYQHLCHRYTCKDLILFSQQPLSTTNEWDQKSIPSGALQRVNKQFLSHFPHRKNCSVPFLSTYFLIYLFKCLVYMSLKRLPDIYTSCANITKHHMHHQ